MVILTVILIVTLVLILILVLWGTTSQRSVGIGRLTLKAAQCRYRPFDGRMGVGPAVKLLVSPYHPSTLSRVSLDHHIKGKFSEECGIVEV